MCADTDEELAQWQENFEAQVGALRLKIGRAEREAGDARLRLDALKEQHSADIKLQGRLQADAEVGAWVCAEVAKVTRDMCAGCEEAHFRSKERQAPGLHASQCRGGFSGRYLSVMQETGGGVDLVGGQPRLVHVTQEQARNRHTAFPLPSSPCVLFHVQVHKDDCAQRDSILRTLFQSSPQELTELLAPSQRSTAASVLLDNSGTPGSSHPSPVPKDLAAAATESVMQYLRAQQGKAAALKVSAPL